MSSAPQKVLLVETQRYRTIIGNVLRRDSRLATMNIEVLEAGNGHDAVALFDTERPQLVITELLLPRLSGFEVVRQIREDLGGKDVPILVTTALAGETTTLSLLERRYAVHVQLKPFPPWSLAQKVRQILSQTSDAHRAPRVSAAAVEKAKKRIANHPPLKEAPSLVDIELPLASDEDETSSSGDVIVNRPPRAEAAPQAAPATPKPGTSARTAPKKGRARKGALAEIGLPRLLLEALEQGLSGTLTLTMNKVKKVIYIHRGVPIFVQSNLRRETIGQALVRKGRLSVEQNRKVVAQAKATGKPYGETAVALGLLSSLEVTEALQHNIRYKLQTSLDWRRGEWVFREDKAVRRKVPTCAIEPVALIIEGLKEKSNAETALHRLAHKSDHRLKVLARFPRYRSKFVAAFGDAAVTLIEAQQDVTVAMVIQRVGSPFEAVLQLDILFKLTMARLLPPAGQGADGEVPTPPDALKPLPTEAERVAESRRDGPLADRPTEKELPLEARPTAASDRREAEQRPEPEPPARTEEPARKPPAIRPPVRPAATRGGFHSGKFSGRRLVQSTYLALHHRNHYELLGLFPEADDEAIEEAYEQVRQRFDPESLGPENVADMETYLKAIHQALDMAYLVLTDPTTREEYDRKLGVK